jgi:superfamily II DNA/RNA helicase
LKFSELSLAPELMEGIEGMGFESTTPVQEKAIPEILNGRDLIAFAQTGTGKTAAFLVPVVQRILQSGHTGLTKAVIIVPTRELAQQIDQQLSGIAYFTGIHSIAVYGGGDAITFGQEKTALTRGADLIICTPGRMIAHLNQGYVKFDTVDTLILDEADRMLDMGFYEDIMKIVSYLPSKRQNLMFSATMPDNIRKMAARVLKDPVEVKIALSKPVEKVLQVAYMVYDKQKPDLVTDLLKKRDLKSVLVFCSTKSSTKQLSGMLKRAGLSATDIHSDLEQAERTRVLNDFKSRQLKILVATDVMSRGIDVENIELVINYDVPHDAEDYIHRIGRTARAESDGIAITLVSEKEQRSFARIEQLLGSPVQKVKTPEHIGKSPDYNPGKLFHYRNRRQKDGRNKGRRK